MKGRDNCTADALSRLPLINSDINDSDIMWGHLAELYGVDKLDSDTFPLT